MSIPSRTWAWFLAPRAGRQPGLTDTTTRPARRPFRPEGLFRSPMNYTTVIPTDLITPLGAYVRLRGERRGGLPARIGRARAARPLLVRRLRRPGRRARRGASSADAPVVGYLAYDHAAVLEPTVPLPAEGPGPPDEPVRRRRHADPLRPRRRPRRGALRRPGGAAGAAGRARSGAAAGRAAAGRPDAPAPGPLRVRARGARREGAHPRRRRLPDRALAARRAADLGERARALPHAPPREPVAVPLPARARRPGADRLLARDARQGRGPPREPEPDRRHDPARAPATPSGCSPRRRTVPST